MRRFLVGLAFVPFLTFGQQPTEQPSGQTSKLADNGTKAKEDALRSLTGKLPNQNESIAMENALRSLTGKLSPMNAQTTPKILLLGDAALKGTCAIPLLTTPGDPAVDPRIAHKLPSGTGAADARSEAQAMRVCGK